MENSLPRTGTLTIACQALEVSITLACPGKEGQRPPAEPVHQEDHRAHSLGDPDTRRAHSEYGPCGPPAMDEAAH